MKKAKDSITDLSAAFGEVAIDAMMEQGVLRDIPILGSAVGVARATRSVRDVLFLKKLQAFLDNFKEVPEEEKEKMRARIADEEQRDRLGEKLVFVLERADELEKARLVAECFAAYCDCDFDVEDLYRAWGALDKCIVDDLQFLAEFEDGASDEHGCEWELLSAGLVQTRITHPRDDWRDPELAQDALEFSLSYAGELLLKVLKRKSAREKECA